MLKKENPEISETIVQYMIDEVDQNGDGQISFEEFINMMQIKYEEEEMACDIITNFRDNEQTNETI